jgi:hypothetical protein
MSRTVPALRARSVARARRQPVTMQMTTPRTTSKRAVEMRGIVTDALRIGDPAAGFPTPGRPGTVGS